MARILLRLLSADRARRGPTLLAASALFLAMAAVMVLPGCGGGRRSAVAGALSRPGPQSIFQADPQLRAHPGSTLNVLRRLGVDRIRVYVPWAALAPGASSERRPVHFDATNPNAYGTAGWSTYDRIVRGAQARGIGLDLLLSGPAPLWAVGADAPTGPFRAAWKPSAPEYGAFVQAIATRYSGAFTPPGSASALPRVGFWSIWNEPNYGPDLAPQAINLSKVEVSPQHYRSLIDAAWTALAHTGHGHDTILIGELAPRGITTGNSPGNFSGMVPLRFVRALYCVDTAMRPLRATAARERGCPADASGTRSFPVAHPALFQASGVSVHPYPQGHVPPNVVTAAEPDYADLATLANLERTLDQALAAYGQSVRFPIYSTEFGFQTDPPEKIARAVSPETASVYLNWSEYISWKDPRVRSYDQYLLDDPPGAGALGGFATGLRFADGAPKATLAAYRLPVYVPITTGKPGQALEVWGCVRPARDARTRTRTLQRVRIEFSPRQGGSFATVKTASITNPHGYFDVLQAFPSSGDVRLTWTYPNGATIHSRTISITIR